MGALRGKDNRCYRRADLSPDVLKEGHQARRILTYFVSLFRGVVR